VDGSGSGSCKVADFGINGIEPLGFAYTVFKNYYCCFVTVLQ
jgi:hypothetical protein